MLAQLQKDNHKNSQSYLSKIASEIHDEWFLFSPEIKGELLHPCFIHSDTYLIVRKGLATDFPAAYRSLCSIASKYGIHIKEDRRTKLSAVKNEKRKKLSLFIGLLMGVTMVQLAPAETLFTGFDNELLINATDSLDISTESQVALSDSSQNINTHLAAKKLANGKIRIGVKNMQASRQDNHNLDLILSCFRQDSAHTTTCQSPEDNNIDQIKTILTEHLVVDSYTSMAVIDDISYYYARYPEIALMLKEMAGLNWTLNISQHTWQAKAHIKYNSVKQVDIFFDPGTAAQMLFAYRCQDNPACTVSPADALLHELLHAYLMLKDPHYYARKNTHSLYPVEHEHEVIRLENQLYNNMTKTDKLPRPNRTKHQATLIAVNCPVCVK